MANTFGARVRQRREQLGLSLNDLAVLLDEAGAPITSQGIHRWEQGHTSPNVDRLETVATVLGLTVAELLNGEVA